MTAYSDLIKRKVKEWNAPDMMEGANKPRGKKLPFSSPLMNWATYGGIPRNMITEFFGVPGGGKTTSAIDICKNAIDIFQQEYDEKMAELLKKAASNDKTAHAKISELEEFGPKKCLYVDLEHSFDADWSTTLGIDITKMDIMQPPDTTAEQILQMVEDAIITGELGMVVLDSIPTLVTKAELEKKYGERTVSALAGLLAVFCRKIVPLLKRYECTLLNINQVRDNMDNPYVVKTPGGQAPKFYAALRIQFKIDTPVDFLGQDLAKSHENPAGYRIAAQIVKQKSAPWDRKIGTYFLMAQSGIRPDYDYANLGQSKYNIIQKSGGWYTLCDPATGEIILKDDGKTPLKINGMAAVYQYLAENREYYDKLKEYILNDINNV